MHGFIHAIHNTVSGKTYVGQTLRHKVERRWYEHKRDLNRGKGTNRHLQGAWTTYGPAAFEFVKLERVVADNRLDLEDALTAREKVSRSLKGNARRKGAPTSAEARANISASEKGKPSPKKGTTMTLGQKLSDAHVGVKFTNEHRATQRAAAKGRTWALVNGVRVYSKTPSKEF
jgi:hypothetical protein